MHRLFVALDLPSAVKSRLNLLCGGVPGARWSTPEQMHLTLRFIGEVDGGTFAEARAALAGVRSPQFELTLRGIGHFATGRKPRALWADVVPNPALVRLRDKIEGRLGQLGLEPEHRKFTPHVTLARLKNANMDRVVQFLMSNDALTLPAFAVEEFVLFSSFPGEEGSLYRQEAIYPLE